MCFGYPFRFFSVLFSFGGDVHSLTFFLLLRCLLSFPCSCSCSCSCSYSLFLRLDLHNTSVRSIPVLSSSPHLLSSRPLSAHNPFITSNLSPSASRFLIFLETLETRIPNPVSHYIPELARSPAYLPTPFAVRIIIAVSSRLVLSCLACLLVLLRRGLQPVCGLRFVVCLRTQDSVLAQ